MGEPPDLLIARWPPERRPVIRRVAGSLTKESLEASRWVLGLQTGMGRAQAVAIFLVLARGFAFATTERFGVLTRTGFFSPVGSAK